MQSDPSLSCAQMSEGSFFSRCGLFEYRIVKTGLRSKVQDTRKRLPWIPAPVGVRNKVHSSRAIRARALCTSERTPVLVHRHSFSQGGHRLLEIKFPAISLI